MKVGYRQPISSFLFSLRTDLSLNTDSVSCQWGDSHGPWGASRLLVVDSLLQTAIKHHVINFWTKKNSLKMIPYSLWGSSILNVFSLTKFNSTSYQTHSYRVRSQPVKIFPFRGDPVLILSRGSDEGLAFRVKGVSHRGYRRTVF